MVFCAQVAREAGIFVLDADYRKGPETMFPGQLHDVEDTMRCVASQNVRFDASRVGVSGFSAGGTLALVAASELRKKTLDQLVKIPVVISFYPATDLSIPAEGRKAPKPGLKEFPMPIINIFFDCYAPDKNMRTDPLVSPGLADTDCFPDTVAILTCEGDNFAPEALALAEKLHDGRRRVVSSMIKNVRHGFDKGGPEKGSEDWERREGAYALAVETLKGALNA